MYERLPWQWLRGIAGGAQLISVWCAQEETLRYIYALKVALFYSNTSIQEVIHL
jgi:hypothetical protein